VEPDTCHDAKQTRKQEVVAGGEGAETGGYQYQCTQYNEYQTDVFADFLHRNVKF
jgi:hypothetical protein